MIDVLSNDNVTDQFYTQVLCEKETCPGTWKYSLVPVRAWWVALQGPFYIKKLKLTEVKGFLHSSTVAVAGPESASIYCFNSPLIIPIVFG